MNGKLLRPGGCVNTDRFSLGASEATNILQGALAFLSDPANPAAKRGRTVLTERVGNVGRLLAAPLPRTSERGSEQNDLNQLAQPRTLATALAILALQRLHVGLVSRAVLLAPHMAPVKLGACVTVTTGAGW